MSSVAGGIDGIEAVFDDASLVADAGLLLAGTVMGRLGLAALIDAVVRPPGAGRGAGAKALSVAASTLKSQLGLERHHGRTRPGVAARVLQRLLALTAAIWRNPTTQQPGPARSLIAYDR